MLTIQDQDNIYSLAEMGEALMVEDLSTGEFCQVDAKEFSPFEKDVFQFLNANNQ